VDLQLAARLARRCGFQLSDGRREVSSSGPPSPCITPSTETIVKVASFMIADPFSYGLM
jgi:hypothetical protein